MTKTILRRRLARSSAFLAACVALISGQAQAELKSLSEDEMSSVDGAGIGVVLEDFVYSHGTDADFSYSQPVESGDRVFKISGLTSPDGDAVEVIVKNLYVAGAGSNFGENLNPVNIGRLVNPFEIDLIDGNAVGIENKAVLQFAAPKKLDPSEGFDCLSSSATAGSGTCASRPAVVGTGPATSFAGERPDIGIQLNAAIAPGQANEDRSAHLNLHVNSAVIDGSYLRLWGDDSREQMAAEIRYNLYSPQIAIDTCSDPTNCQSRIYLKDFSLELALGNKIQPVYFNVDEQGQFVFEVATVPQPAAGAIGADGTRASSDPATYDFYEDYYTNPEYRSNLNIGNISIGNDSGSYDFGTSRIDGMLVQHLKVRTQDL